MRSFCESGTVLAEMRARGIEPNVISYNAAISACEKGSQWERALELLGEMRTRGVEPNVINYNTALRALCRHGTAFGRRRCRLVEQERVGQQRPRGRCLGAACPAVALLVARALPSPLGRPCVRAVA